MDSVSKFSAGACTVSQLSSLNKFVSEEQEVNKKSLNKHIIHANSCSLPSISYN